MRVSGGRIEYYSNFKKKEILPFATTATNPECMLNKIRHKKTNIMLKMEINAVNNNWWVNYDV